MFRTSIAPGAACRCVAYAGGLHQVLVPALDRQLCGSEIRTTHVFSGSVARIGTAPVTGSCASIAACGVRFEAMPSVAHGRQCPFGRPADAMASSGDCLHIHWADHSRRAAPCVHSGIVKPLRIAIARNNVVVAAATIIATHGEPPNASAPTKTHPPQNEHTA